MVGCVWEIGDMLGGQAGEGEGDWEIGGGNWGAEGVYE